MTRVRSAWWLVTAVVLSASLAVAGEVAVGEKFPEISGKDSLTGKPVSLKALAGKVVVVDFWATWCGPCRREIPHIRELYETYAKDGLEIVGISLDRSEQKLQSYVKDEKLGWQHIFDRGSQIARRFDVTGIPMIYVVGRDGLVVARDVRGPALKRAVERALKAPAPAGTATAATGTAATGTAATGATQKDAAGEPVPDDGAADAQSGTKGRSARKNTQPGAPEAGAPKTPARETGGAKPRASDNKGETSPPADDPQQTKQRKNTPRG